MVLFKTISFFRKQIEALKKVRRNVYAGLEKEIFTEFSNKDIAVIRGNRDMILIEDEFIVIKFRLADKKQRLSKRDGYRLIYLVSKTDNLVVFLDVYPKNGPLQKLDIDDNSLKNLLIEYIKEGEEGKLEDYRFSTQ